MTDEAKLPDGRVFRDGVEIESVGLGEQRPVTTFGDARVKIFHRWFEHIAISDAEMIWEKAREYGSFTLTAEALGVLTGQDQGRLNQEAVLATNVAQKLNRIMEALFRGELPSEDCWRDLACYAMIARRLRETKGAWPA